MTAHQFIGAWDDATSTLHHLARAADDVTDLPPETRTSLRRSLEVALDTLDLARRSNRLAIMGALDLHLDAEDS